MIVKIIPKNKILANKSFPSGVFPNNCSAIGSIPLTKESTYELRLPKNLSTPLSESLGIFAAISPFELSWAITKLTKSNEIRKVVKNKAPIFLFMFVLRSLCL